MKDDIIPAAPQADRWLLLIHQLPAKPAYLRVKVWRRLQALGAVTVKNSVYALPANEQTQEDFEWLLKEIAEAGGEAMICEARLIDGLSDQEVRSLFNAARTRTTSGWPRRRERLPRLLAGRDRARGRADARARLARLKASAAQIVAIDFFGANGRETVDGLAREAWRPCCRKEATMQTDEAPQPRPPVSATLKGRVWVTRQGVHVDRIASRLAHPPLHRPGRPIQVRVRQGLRPETRRTALRHVRGRIHP